MHGCQMPGDHPSRECPEGRGPVAGRRGCRSPWNAAPACGRRPRGVPTSRLRLDGLVERAAVRGVAVDGDVHDAVVVSPGDADTAAVRRLLRLPGGPLRIEPG